MTDRYHKPSEILYKAAEILQERGHCKGDYQNRETGAVCALGALNAAVTGDATYFAAAVWGLGAEAKDRLISVLPDGWGDHIPKFNDAPETTAEDVLLAFKHAAHAAEEAGE